MTRFETTYYGLKPAKDPTWCALVNVVLAIGSRASPGSNEEQTYHLFENALGRFSHVILGPSCLCKVQVLILMVCDPLLSLSCGCGCGCRCRSRSLLATVPLSQPNRNTALGIHYSSSRSERSASFGHAFTTARRLPFFTVRNTTEEFDFLVVVLS